MQEKLRQVVRENAQTLQPVGQRGPGAESTVLKERKMFDTTLSKPSELLGGEGEGDL